MDEEIEFEKDWLSVEKLEFKMLTLITVLADNHLAYRGTLTNMCEFFGIQSRDSRNNAKIRTAIKNLEEKGLIKTLLDGRTWTLTLSRSAERKSKVIKIKRDWVNAVRSCKAQGVAWSSVLKVWLFLIDNREDIIKSKDIGNALGISESSVLRAREVLIGINAIRVNKINIKTSRGGICCLGSRVDVNAWIDD